MLYDIVLVSAIHECKSARGVQTSSPSGTSLPPPPHPTSTPSHPSTLLQSPGLSSLSRTANARWLSTLHVMVCVCPCDSIHSSRPRLPPQLCALVSSLCLCLHCCPANMFISTISLDSVYVLIYNIVFSLSDLLHLV